MTAAGVGVEEQDVLLSGLLTGSPENLEVSERERALLRYADQLTQRPWTITMQDIMQLREVRLDDRAIHDACAIVSYYAFVNRVADGLGVELEVLREDDR